MEIDLTPEGVALFCIEDLFALYTSGLVYYLCYIGGYRPCLCTKFTSYCLPNSASYDYCIDLLKGKEKTI